MVIVSEMRQRYLYELQLIFYTIFIRNKNISFIYFFLKIIIKFIENFLIYSFHKYIFNIQYFFYDVIKISKAIGRLSSLFYISGYLKFGMSFFIFSFFNTFSSYFYFYYLFLLFITISL